MEPKTLKEVYSKKTNRILKVIYFFVYLLAFVAAIADFSDFVTFGEFVVGSFIFFEIIKRCFYYITAGTPFPEDFDIYDLEQTLITDR